MSGSTLDFADDREVEIHQYAVTATVGQTRASRWSWRVSLGAVVGGALTEGDRRHEIGPGVLGAVGVSRPWTRGDWFVIGSLGFAASRATTREDRGAAPRVGIVAADLRAGVMAGRRFGAISPYVLARGFGGPVLWQVDDEEITGSDVHHVQAGAGVSATLSSRVTLLVDVSALGERAASLGLTLQL